LDIKEKLQGNTVEIIKKYLIVIFLFVVSLIFSIAQPLFASFYNLSNVLMQTSLLATIAIGLTYVMIMNEFDLSFAFLASLGVNMAVNIVQWDIPGFLAIITPLMIGLLIGFINGLVVAGLSVNSFIATLGMGTILMGVNFFICGGKTIVVVGGVPRWFVFPAQEQLFGFSYLTYMMIVVILVSILILNYTVFGRTLYAIGGNVSACIVAGIKVKRNKIYGFMISGFLAGLTGLLLAARLGGGHPNAGDEFLMNGFAAAFLGMAMKNGVPSILGTFIGALLITTIWNGITMVGLPYELQLIITALIIIVFASLSYGMKGKSVKV